MSAPQPTSINDAHAELSRPAFAAWMLLMEATPENLSSKQQAARMLGYTRQHGERILRELAEKGFIRAEPGVQKFTAIRIVLAKILSINGQENSSSKKILPARKMLHEEKCCTKKNVARRKMLHEDEKPQSKQTPTSKNIEIRSSSDEAVSVGGSGGGSIQDPVLTEDLDQLKDSVLTPRSTARRAAPTRANGNEKQENPSPEDNKKASPGVNLNKIALAAEVSKAKRRQRNRAARRRTKAAPPSGEDLGLLQDTELPSATFEPGPKQRARMVEILARQPGDRERRKLARGLGDSFRRVYTKYRHRFQPGFQCPPPQYKFAERAAALCVMLEVKPMDLIAYWTEHVGDFTDMKYPSLSFLSAAGNVDKVACLRGATGGKAKAEKAGKPCEVDSTHSYADTSKLDPRLRPGLLGAGFDLTGQSDRDLMSIQNAAETLIMFPDAFISAKMRPWVDWAAEHVYQKAATGGER